MFRKPNRPGSSSKSSMSQLGIFGMPDEEDDGDVSDGDMDLEAELAAISGENYKPRPRPRPAAPAPDLNTMIAASLRDIPSDEDVSDGDEDDPDLLSELKELAIEDSEAAPPPRAARPAPPPPAGAGGVGGIVGLLQERIANYTLAEKNAKANGESSRSRRFNRGLKTLNDQLRQAKAGRAINEDDIPPIVSTGKQTPAPPPPDAAPSAPEEPPEASVEAMDESPSSPVEAPSEPEPQPAAPSVPSPPPMDEERQKGLRLIMQRREEFKAAALAAKHTGEKAIALEHLKMAKQFDLVAEAYRNGEPMDLSELPTPQGLAAARPQPQKEENPIQQNSSVSPSEPEEEQAAPAGLITAGSVGEALKQRLDVFKEQVAKAKEQGNSSKMRRMGRIVKQYEDAIKLHAAGKPIPVAELPTPPGYAPIPDAATAGAPSPPQRDAAAPAPSPRPAHRPAPAPRPAPAAPAASTSRAAKQLAFLLHRQKEFKEAALAAKKDGDVGLAKEYLRNAKGFDSVIEAARGGLVVDLNSLPLPPQAKEQLEETFDHISADDCVSLDSASSGDSDVLSRLQEQLNTQLKLCLATRDHNKAMGNVAETNRFEHLANSVKQDLDVVSLAKRTGADIPKFHYEMRQFAVIQCNTDLNDNDLELTIVRGITYNVPNPKDVDTYVRFEFPFPQEAPVSDKTALVKDTNSPEYNAVFPLSIARSSRACLRIFKRHAIKLEVYSRGGFFSRDSLLGTALVKLQPLETHTTIHEAFPLMEGRRSAGGSVEVKVRIRNPLLGKQVDHSNHKWLVIDHSA